MMETKFHSERKLRQALRAAENKYMRRIRAIRLTLDRVIGKGHYITDRATHPDCLDDSPPFRDLEAKLLHRIVDIHNDLHAWKPAGVRVVERQPERTSGGCEVLLDFQHGINRSRRISVRCFHGYPWSSDIVKECTAWARTVASDHRVSFDFMSASS